MKRLKMIIFLMIVLISLTSLMGCEKEKVDIYTSVYALNFITKEITKDKLKVESIYPKSCEIHDYEPNPKALINMSDAKIIFYIGQGLEAFVEKGIDSTFKNVTCVKLTDFPDIKSQLIKTHNDHHHKTNEEFTDETAFDAHIWLDPFLMIAMSKHVLESILKIDEYKVYKEEFTKNFNDLELKFYELAKEYQNQIDNTKRMPIIVEHDAYAYLSQRFFIERKSLRSDNDIADPTSSDLMNILDLACRYKLKYLLATVKESSTNLTTSYIKGLNKLDKSINAQVLYFDNLEVLLDDSTDYFMIMRENLRILIRALNNE